MPQRKKKRKTTQRKRQKPRPVAPPKQQAAPSPPPPAPVAPPPPPPPVSVLVDAIPPQCPRQGCRSTERKHFVRVPRVRRCRGVIPKTDRPYNQITMRTAECLGCGQRYIVRTYENVPGK